jgi:hypothetical protein
MRAVRRKPPVKVLAMRDKPLAFFLTWSCYGCWLPGDDRGYVDREHNQYGRPRLEPRPRLAEFVLKNLADPPFALSNRVFRGNPRSRLRLPERANHHVHVVVGHATTAGSHFRSIQGRA